MGEFTIIIEGMGAHHNKDNPGDANILFKKFVTELKEHGHSIVNASILTSQGREVG